MKARKNTIVSVAELLNKNEEKESLDFGIKGYSCPKYPDWRKIPGAKVTDERGDYITIASEEKPHLNLTKIFFRKKSHM